MVQQLETQLAERDTQLAEQEQTIAQLQQRIRLLQKALFGPRSERLVDEPGDQGEFNDLLAELEHLTDQLDQAAESPSQDKRPRDKKKKRRNLAELAPDDLPVKEVLLDVPEEDRICLETGEELQQIREERSRKLAYQPGSYYWIEYVRPVYICSDHPGEGVSQAPMPQLAIPRCDYDESLIAAVAVDKCAYHLPLYRQEERCRHQHVHLSRQTLNHLYMRSADVLRPLYQLMLTTILSGRILFTDDTPVKLQLKGKGKTVTGRMWVYIGGGHSPPYRLFEFTRDRKKERPQQFLGDFAGHIHADAYKGYDHLFKRDHVHECACWMHVRRKFVDAIDGPPELRRDILMFIRHLYRYERLARQHDSATILSIRQKKIRPLIDRIFHRCQRAIVEHQVIPSTDIHDAIGYLQNRGKALYRFLDDPYLQPDNGESERAIRPLAIGRRNWLFAGSKRGGDATSIHLSIIQSCRVLGIDPFTYLTDVLRRINATHADQLEQLLPHNWQPQTLLFSTPEDDAKSEQD